MFKKIILISFLMMIISTTVFATTIEEKTLNSLGHQNIIIDQNEDVCYKIDVPQLKNLPNSTFVFVIDIENHIPITAGVTFDIYLNDYLEKTITAENIKKKNIIEMYNYQQNKNEIKLCVKNDFLPRIIISNQSKIGNYLLAKITKEDIYQIAPNSIKTETLIPIDIVFKNQGANAVQVKVENSLDRYLINNYLSHISGEYEYEGILEAGEEKSIRYFIKAKDDLLYLSPRAKLTYTNEFGEKIEILSDPLLITAEKKKDLLDIFIDISTTINNKTTTQGILILRNNSNKEITDLFISKTSIEAVEIKDKTKRKINANEVIEIPFEVKAYNNKDFAVTFNIGYFSENIEYKQSEKINFNIKQKQEHIFEVIGIFVLIFIIVYVWFLKN